MGSFFRARRDGCEKSAILAGKLKKAKWVRLVIFVFERLAVPKKGVTKNRKKPQKTIKKKRSKVTDEN